MLSPAPAGTLTVANRLTRVPERPVPPLDGLGAVLAVADAFMLAMISRPSTGSLRCTWVTPATLALCASTVVGAILAAGWLVARGGFTLLGAIGVGVLAVAAAGAGCVLAVGIVQRRAA